MSTILENKELIAWAFAHTIVLFVIAGLLSMILGTLLAALRVGPVGILRRASSVYVTLVRNTPLVVVFLFFRVAGPRVGIQFNFVDIVWGDLRMNNYFAAAVLSLTVYTSAFICEALRSGINAVSLGQAEAARAIGLPFAGVMQQVVLPQAFQAAVPPLASVQIALLKNTTVAGVFGIAEAFFRMGSFTNNNPGDRYGIFLAFALIFVVLVEMLSFGANRLERRWSVAR